MAVIECVPNVSEGRRPDVIEQTGRRAASAVPGMRVLDVQSDATHNRSVFTLAGDAAALTRRHSDAVRGRHRRHRPANAQGRASAPGRGRRRAVHSDRRRDDGGVRGAGQGRSPPTSRRASRCRSISTKTPRRIRRARTSRTSAAASSRAWRRRWRKPEWAPDFGPAAPHPTRRRVGDRRAHAAHRLQHQPRHQSSRRRQEDRRRRSA